MAIPLRLVRPRATLAILLGLLAVPAPAQTVRQVADLLPAPGVGSMDRTQLVVSGIRPGEVFLALDDGVHGTELWRSDGTAAGTALLVDLTPGAADSDISWVVVRGLEAWLLEGRGPQEELWRTDGSAAGTRRVLTAAGLSARSLTPPLAFLPNGQFLLSVDGVLWRSDGTRAGTSSLGLPFDWLHEAGGVFYTVRAATGEVHRTDGTVAGTALVATGVAGASPALGGLVLRVPNGPNATTLRLLGVTGTPSITLPESVTAYVSGETLAILGTSTLWRWDGSANARVLGTFATLVDPAVWVRFAPRRDGSAMLFMADDGVHGFEPWWTDFTAGGTRLLVDLTPGAASSPVDSIMSVGDRVLFWAWTAAAGSEPWSTDGTAAGTVPLGDLEPGPNSSAADVFSGAGGVLSTRRIVLPISTAATGFEPWITDGTAVGTRMLADLNPGPASSTGFSFWGWPAGTSLVFAADDGSRGREPWALDLEGAVSPLPSGCHTDAYYAVEDPVIGAPWPMEVRNAPAAGVALISRPSRLGVDLGDACTLVLDPVTSVVATAITPDPLGRWSTTYPIPNDPGLRGVALTTQAALLDPSRPLGVVLLGAFWLTVGY